MKQVVESWGLYIVFVVVGFIFRTALYNPFETNSMVNRKNIMIQIGIIVFITVGANGTFGNGFKDLGAYCLLFMGYCFYALTKRVGSKGYTENILVIIDGYMVTTLSFMSFPGNVIMIGITVFLAFIAYKYWFNEKKYDFWSIILACVEALVLSAYVRRKQISGFFDTAIVVIFVETFVFMTNCFFKLLIVKLCGGDEEEYWLMLRGIDAD